MKWRKTIWWFGVGLTGVVAWWLWRSAVDKSVDADMFSWPDGIGS